MMNSCKKILKPKILLLCKTKDILKGLVQLKGKLHEKSVLSTTDQCEICSMVFSQKALMHSHNVSDHEVKNHCNANFNEKKNLKK